MDARGLTVLEIAQIAMEKAQEEYNERKYYYDEICAAIEAIEDFCEDSTHKSAILAELADQKERAEELFNAAEQKMNAADEHYSALENAERQYESP